MGDIDCSIVMATHDESGLMPLTLQHIESQEYPAARYELVVADRGSGNKTSKMLRRYQAGSPVRMHILEHLEGVSTVAALNAAAEATRGHCLLFLEPWLLPGEQLVGRHVKAHQADKQVGAVVGRVDFHPQIRASAFTRWFYQYEYPRPEGGGALDFLEWRAGNLSIGRELLLEAGGFDEAFAYPLYHGAELAWRVARHGIKGVYEPEAVAYGWQRVVCTQAFEREYARGYALYTLLEKTRDIVLYQRFPVKRHPLLKACDRLVMPSLKRFCRGLESDTRLFGNFYQRILRYNFQRGYHDAAHGRPPAYPDAL
ncbi:MAG: glycosyltransferase [Candidatus Hydrogenedentota bacterium]